jgi:uncharacterized protein (TIGR00303 family)
MNNLIKIHTAPGLAQPWLNRYRGKKPCFICVLGFTQTALIADISAAGATPEARQFTAVADAEFLFDGPTPNPAYALPSLQAGVSPALISRAILTAQAIPVYLFNAGLLHPLTVPHIDLGGSIARCVSSGQALPEPVVNQLFKAGWHWGELLGRKFAQSYLVIGECVVAGTTTAQAILTGLGAAVTGKMNSSHPTCNHSQKQSLVNTGLTRWQQTQAIGDLQTLDPLKLVAAVGDPMQPVVAGLALAASHHCGILLAGGSQMIAVYRLLEAIAQFHHHSWMRANILVGTTRWVIEDASSDTVGLARMLGNIPLASTQLSFAHSQYPQLQIFEQGFVKEGVGAGGCAISAQLYQGWHQTDLLHAIETLLAQASVTTMGQ